jgi:RNA polymerase sigma-70 factor (ECF subfamily)
VGQDGQCGADPAARRLDYETAMKLLTADEVVLVDLHYKKGFSHTELAEVLNLPLGTVKTKLRSALQRLSGSLREAT